MVIFMFANVCPVQFSHSVMSYSLQPHESQHARPPCPSPTPGVHSDSRPSSQWCHPAISSSIVPFSSCPQSLPASESFPMSQLFAWGGHGTLFSEWYLRIITIHFFRNSPVFFGKSTFTNLVAVAVYSSLLSKFKSISKFSLLNSVSEQAVIIELNSQEI